MKYNGSAVEPLHVDVVLEGSDVSVTTCSRSRGSWKTKRSGFGLEHKA